MPTVQIWPPPNPGTISGGPVLTIDPTLLSATALLQQAGGNVNLVPTVNTYVGSADVVTFSNPVNVAIFTGAGGTEAATLATPGAGDAGKILVLANATATQNVVTAGVGIINSGSATAGSTLTAAAHVGSVAFLVATNGKWCLAVGGTGSWTLT